MIFDSDKIWEIQNKAIEWSLDERRDMLLLGINRVFVAELPGADNSAAQILSDLKVMSEAGKIVNDQVPLERWLRNAAKVASVFPDRQSYFLGLANEAKVSAAAIELATSSAGGSLKPFDGPRIPSYLPGGGVLEREKQPAPPRDPGQATTSAKSQVFQFGNAAVILMPLLIFASTGTLHLIGIKAWEALSPIAAVLAVWYLFRLWWPSIVAPADDAAIITTRYGTLILLLSIAASGLLLL